MLKAGENYSYEGIELKKYQKLAVALDVLHHDPEIYPEPYSFNPDRFLHEGTKTKDVSFMPFGAGPRNCIGIINLIFNILFKFLILDFPMIYFQN